MSALDIRLDRINGTAIQWFTARTDEPRAAIVANILVNEELPTERIHRHAVDSRRCRRHRLRTPPLRSSRR